MRKAEAILARYPGPVTLTTSRLKMLALFLVSLAFVAGGLWVQIAAPDIIESGEGFFLWLAILFFALCMAVGAVSLLPGAGNLTLTADGFEVCNLFKRFSVPWADASGFRVEEIDDGESVRSSKFVGFDVRTAGIGPQRRGATKVGGALPDNYRLSYEELAALMTRWRAKALGVVAAPKPAADLPHGATAAPGRSAVPHVRAAPRDADSAG